MSGKREHSRRYYIVRGIVRAVWIIGALVFCFYCVIR